MIFSCINIFEGFPYLTRGWIKAIFEKQNDFKGTFSIQDTLKDDWQGSDGCLLAREVLASGLVIYIILKLKEKLHKCLR